jgi:hypothetical protein
LDLFIGILGLARRVFLVRRDTNSKRPLTCLGWITRDCWNLFYFPWRGVEGNGEVLQWPAVPLSGIRKMGDLLFATFCAFIAFFRGKK